MKALFLPLIKPFQLLLPLMLLLLGAPKLLPAQGKQVGTLDFLTAANGINGINLGADITSLGYSNLSFLDGDASFDPDSCQRFAISDSIALKINNKLTLDLIGIRTYKNKIVNIYLFFRQADAYLILNDFLSAYGVFTSKPVEYANIYNWNSKSVSLSLMYRPDIDDGIAVFTCNPLAQRVSAIKEMAGLKKNGDTLKHSDQTAKSASLLSSTNP